LASVSRLDTGYGRAMSDEPQDIAEALDADVISDNDDYTGDEVPAYPPETPLGLDEFDLIDRPDSTTPAEQLRTEGLDLIPDEPLSGEAVQVTGVDLSAEEEAVHIENL